MPTEINKQIELEIAHVLFIDIVGYSKLSINQQRAVVDELAEVVRSSGQYQKAETAGRLIKIPTGDGMALVFYTSPEAPAQCAVEISGVLKEHPSLPLRMGVHSGPVSGVIDVNGQANLAGAGLNMAQRVMGCGDAGHILVSKRVADDLGEYEHWRPLLHDLGECEVKHGMRVSIVNLHADEVGNPQLPKKFQALKKHRARMRWVATTAALLALAVIVAGMAMFSRYRMGSTLAAPEKSIAVLPFENLSTDPQNAFFAGGVQDEILSDLAKIADLKVISRSSVMQYRSGIARNLREIGKQLGVAHLLEGSVQRAEGKVRVNAQLIDAQTDAHLWAQTYDRDLADVFAIQSDIARSIAEQLQAKLAPEEKTRITTKPTENPEAYLLYLQANDLVHVAASKQDGFNAGKIYQQAIALDPNFALARAKASMLNSLIYFIGRIPERKTSARALADEALQLAPNLGEAHLALGLCFYRIDSDYDRALKELAIAGAASPNDSEILDSSGYIYRRQGRWREALAAFAQARQLDPRRAHFDAAPETLRVLRQWTAASDAYKQGLQLEPQLIDGWTSLAYVEFAQSGTPASARATLDRLSETIKNKAAMARKWDFTMLARDFAAAEAMLPDIPSDDFPGIDARAFYEGCIAFARHDPARAHSLFEQIRPEYEAGARDNPDDPVFHAALGRLYVLLGQKEDAIREARRAVELCPVSKDALAGPVYAANLAFVYAQSGEVEQAVTLLSRLLTTPGAERITLAHLRLGWEWDPLRQDPRFKALIEGPEPLTVYN
jgi:TolB-like protein/class 3 adenylate cyclase/Flp pilus assembly protein TadD